MQYFARLSQRLIGALTALTSEGRLYEVDMRLRPAGASGPIATSLEGFTRYQNEEAWTWEHQALVRARVLAGCARLTADFERVRAAVLGRARDLDALRREVSEMRAKMRDNLGTRSSHAGVDDNAFEAAAEFNLNQKSIVKSPYPKSKE